MLSLGDIHTGDFSVLSDVSQCISTLIHFTPAWLLQQGSFIGW